MFIVCLGAVTEGKEVEEVSSVSADSGSVSPSKPGKGESIALYMEGDIDLRVKFYSFS